MKDVFPDVTSGLRGYHHKVGKKISGGVPWNIFGINHLEKWVSSNIYSAYPSNQTSSDTSSLAEELNELRNEVEQLNELKNDFEQWNELRSEFEQFKLWTGWEQVERNREDIITIRKEISDNTIDISVNAQDVADLQSQIALVEVDIVALKHNNTQIQAQIVRLKDRVVK